jgi:hypothetical protein
MSDAWSALESIAQRLRREQRWGDHVTLRGLIGAWEGLVDEVEDGYTMCSAEYSNDVDSRRLLARIAAAAEPPARSLLLERLASLDARFIAATRPEARRDGPFDRIPLELVGELREDVESLGL